ncbi:N-formylglutamate amidohydrolase [Novosphingobium nitrogenifigens DSM 19370]|uniref:N-formylglutamate amidohydrolase n=1 Tax=Novosphingobium nitrogenifigens DSM 19370 TaxID=983920 RepID=F1ZA77_9SPHN|nr:N-formylglutamate amidohydrolase [Novosphingobium nitrogenifigens]EGD58515.1 N-formylglutamate amidohydrolase [Novosphingobium nitrogenifigens DSM 19370]
MGESGEAWRLVGTPRAGGILVVSDHASNRVPADIDLGIAPALLDCHVAVDIGVAGIGERLAARPGFAAFLGNVSRLVCDLNRHENEPSVIPIASDGHAVPGNALDHAGHEARIARFHRPYHAALADLLDREPPGLILSIHSFTPHLETRPDEKRPWHIGVLYNEDRRGPGVALDLLRQENGLCVGDQEPYSGQLLNETMNRHAEGRGRLYFGVEVRQDLIADAAGQEEWANRLERVARGVLAHFA